jgi:hypothetical protein
VVDFGRFASNKKKVEKFCKGRKDENLMNAIRKSRCLIADAISAGAIAGWPRRRLAISYLYRLAEINTDGAHRMRGA